MVDTYMDFGVAIAEEDGILSSCAVPALEGVQEIRDVLIVDMFCTPFISFVEQSYLVGVNFAAASHKELCLVAGNIYVASTCVCRGWIPVSPFIPTAVITIHTLEVYHVLQPRCPRLGIQAFVQTLCDTHSVAPHQWLATQFLVAFDVYLVIRTVVDRCMQVALGHDTLHWCLKNTCPCCLYKLEGEPFLKIPLMGTFDGNNSHSRFWLHEKVELDKGVFTLGASKERVNDCVAPGDYHLMREDTDKWAKEGGGPDEEFHLQHRGRGGGWVQQAVAEYEGGRHLTHIVQDLQRNGVLPRALSPRLCPQGGGHGEEW
jgi:hypothetical protein